MFRYLGTDEVCTISKRPRSFRNKDFRIYFFFDIDSLTTRFRVFRLYTKTIVINYYRIEIRNIEYIYIIYTYIVVDE